MRVLSPVVEPFVLAVFELQAQPPAGCGVALELVCHHDPRCLSLLSQQLSHQPLCGLGIAPALHEHVKNVSIFIYRSPQPMLLAFDSDDHFIEMPLIAKVADPSPNTLGYLLAKGQRPLTHRFLGHLNAACGQHFFDHPQAQRKTVVKPYRVADHFWRKTVASVGDGSVRRRIDHDQIVYESGWDST